MTRADPLAEALERTQQHLFAASTAEALIARREAGRELPSDGALASDLADALCAEQHPDGSWAGDLVTTAESLLLLRGLGPEARALESARGIAWLIARQGAPGRFGESCTPELHELELCGHAGAPFFSPTAPRARLSGVRLVTGGMVQGDSNARFAASALALRALLEWRMGGSDAASHVAALDRALAAWSEWDDGVISPAGRLLAAATLLEAPRTAARDAVLERVVALVGRSQRGDGTWSGADVFEVLAVLAAAAERGLDGATIARAARGCAGTIGVWLDSVSGFTREEVPRRSLIVWRALRQAVHSSDPIPEEGTNA